MRVNTSFLVLVLALVALLGRVSCGTTLLTETFDGGIGAWQQVATATTTTSPRLGSSGLAARIQNQGSIARVVSTVGYGNIVVTFNLAASSLEGVSSNDRCHFEYSVDKGQSYTSIRSLIDGEDNSVYRSGSYALPASANNNPDFMIRYRISADASGDSCFAETTTVSGTAQTFSAPPAPVMQTTYDTLTGNGAVTRTLLTYAQLTGTGQITGPIDLSAFAIPANAAQPTNFFHGTLEGLNEASVANYAVIRDDYSYAGNVPRRSLPDFYVELLSHGSHMVPRVRGLNGVSHPYWEIIFQAGRVWNENGDNGFSRVALPFAITQKNSNCIHQGLMMFLFKTGADGQSVSSISRLYYQISQETCLYYKVNMWGTLNVAGVTRTIANAATVRSEYETEVANRIPVRPLSQLATDFPGVDVSKIGSEQNTGHLSALGLEVDGFLYRGAFPTRHGNYPYPDSMVFPSYSTAKTWFVSLGAMALDQQYPSYNLYERLVTQLVPQASPSVWGQVRVKHLLDMASGFYSSAGFQADEDALAMENGFYLRETHNQRINYALTYATNKSAPGTFFCYTTATYYILATALRTATAALEPATGTFSNYCLNRLFKPMKLSPVTYTPKATYDSLLNPDLTVFAQELGGYGEYMTLDDFAKIGQFMNANEGKINGVQVVNYNRLKDALQRDTTDPGFTGTTQQWGGRFTRRYNEGVWAIDQYPSTSYPQMSNCGGRFEPYLSGFGGIRLALLKSKLNYMFVSDDYILDFDVSANEIASKVRAPCTTTYTP